MGLLYPLRHEETAVLCTTFTCQPFPATALTRGSALRQEPLERLFVHHPSPSTWWLSSLLSPRAKPQPSRSAWRLISSRCSWQTGSLHGCPQERHLHSPFHRIFMLFLPVIMLALCRSLPQLPAGPHRVCHLGDFPISPPPFFYLFVLAPHSSTVLLQVV